MKKMMVALCLGLAICGSVSAATWRGVEDANGCTWARVKIVNESAADSNWAIWNGRTAVASTASSAETDAQLDWSGVAEAGTTEYVWVYGYGIADINFDNADGGASAFTGTELPQAGGDGEVVITIAADGTASADVVASEAYEAPSQAGSMPVNE